MELKKIILDKELVAIPILMITAVNSKYAFSFSPETDGKYLPVDDFVDKPVQPDELINRVEKLLEQKTSVWINWPDKREDPKNEN